MDGWTKETSMQRIAYRLKRKDKSHSNPVVSHLPSQSFKRVNRFVPTLFYTAFGTKKPLASKKFAKTKMLVQISSIALLSLPAKSLTTSLFSTDSVAYDKVMASNTLTLASVKGDSTYFATDGFQHGFGYDIARSYANQLGVTLQVQDYPNEAQALQAVRQGKADMALTTASTKLTEDTGLSASNISCGFDTTLATNGLHPKTNWAFRSGNDPLAIKASDFLCENGQLINTAKIANFYDQTLLKDDYNREHFEQALTANLPHYKSSFQQQADTYDHDWQLLVAMGYQESHLDANATSPTGVRGLMMLTNNTAKAMGVSDRIDPYQSIGGGARYLEQMKAEFRDVPNPDRLWFALASYNMGPNAVKSIQSKVSKAGQDPKSWTNVYAYMSDHAGSNSRYTQCMHYVTNIRSYLESLKMRTA